MTRRLEPDPELDGLVRELNQAARVRGGGDGTPAGEAEAKADPEARPREAAEPPRWRLPPSGIDAAEHLDRLIARARERFGTDLLLVSEAPPTVRIDGRLEPLAPEPLSAAAAAELCAVLVPRERRPELGARGSLDFSHRTAGRGRYRCNVHRERGRWSAAVRLFSERPPDLAELNLPDRLRALAERPYGLVLVTGPTGSGKSTTIAALVRDILSRRRVHMITIEDPVEYEHTHTDSVVEHVEVGRDALSFADALRSVLRQDPDVLVIGEMRDRESISIAMTAAETGHLVLSTLHTGDAPNTVHRILDSYPQGQAETVRAQLAGSLGGIVSQQLVPRADGRGRIPAVEILVATPAVRNLIRRGRIEQLRTQIALERAEGMLDLDESLATLVRAGRIEADEARARARVPESFDQLLQRRPGAD